MIAQQAMSVAIQKAKKNVISALSVYNCNHVGRLASYTMMAADYEMIGMMMVNAGGQTVAPFGGIARRLATNPISIAVPTGKANPIVLDIATSVAPEGKIRAMRNRGATCCPKSLFHLRAVLLLSCWQGHPMYEPQRLAWCISLGRLCGVFCGTCGKSFPVAR